MGEGRRGPIETNDLTLPPLASRIRQSLVEQGRQRGRVLRKACSYPSRLQPLQHQPDLMTAGDATGENIGAREGQRRLWRIGEKSGGGGETRIIRRRAGIGMGKGETVHRRLSSMRKKQCAQFSTRGGCAQTMQVFEQSRGAGESLVLGVGEAEPFA